jgi:6-phosphogluconolactonase
MPLRIVPDASALAEAAARETVALGRDALATRARFLIALSGGSTPRALHARLASPDRRADLDWSRAEFLWSDERSVPPDHADSNYRMARETLLAPLGVLDHQVHRMVGEAPDLDAAARDYEGIIATLTGGEPAHDVPALDLVLLGMGPDGHTASLFPGTTALDARDRWVVANDVPQLHTARLTFTFDLILGARAVLVLVAGADKADALAAVWEGPRDPRRFPAQHLALTEPHVLWMVDRAAAGRLAAPPAGADG